MKLSPKLECLESAIDSLMHLLNKWEQGQLVYLHILPDTDKPPPERLKAFAAQLSPENQMSILNGQTLREENAIDPTYARTSGIVRDAVMMIADTLSCLERTCLAGSLLNTHLQSLRGGEISTKESELFVSGFLYDLPPERLEHLTKLFGKVAKRKRAWERAE